LLLVTFAEETEEHIDFPLGKIDIAAEFVDDDDIEAVQLREGGGELEVALGREQATGQLEGRDKQHLQFMALEQLASEGGAKAGLAPARQSDGDQIVTAAHKIARPQGRQYPADLFGHLRLVEAGEGLGRRQARVFEQTLDFAGAAILHLRFGQMLQEPAIAPVLGFGTGQGTLRFTRKGGQLQGVEQDGQTFRVHALTSVNNES
jgi:hypothetical protein